MAETNSGKLLSDDDLLGLDVDLALEKLDREKKAASDKTSPSFADYARGLASGVNNIITTAGEGLNLLGAEKIGKAVREFGQSGEQYWQEAMTPAGKEAAGGDLENRPLSTIGMAAAQSLPGMAAMFVPGLGATKALQAANMVRPVFGALKDVGVGAKRAAKIARASPVAVGMGASEGVYSGLSNAAQTAQEIAQTPIDQLSQTPAYRAIEESNPNLVPEEIRNLLSAEAERQVALRTAPWTGAIGALTGGGILGQIAQKATGGVAKNIVKGAAKEAGQEIPQSGGEAYIQNVVAGETYDPSRPATRDVAKQAIIGGGAGGLLGGLGGGVHALSKPQLNPHEELLNKTAETVIATRNAETKLTTEAANDRTKPDTAAGKKTAKAAEETDAAGQTVLEGTPSSSPIRATMTIEKDGKRSVKTTHKDGSVDVDGVQVVAPDPTLQPITVARVRAERDAEILSSQPPAIDNPESVIVNPAQAISGETGGEKQAISGAGPAINPAVLAVNPPIIPDETPTPVQESSAFANREQPEITMAEVEKVRDIPTVEMMREAIAAVGEDEFQRQAQAKIEKYKPTSPDQEAMLVEATATEIVVKNRRKPVAIPGKSPAVSENGPEGRSDNVGGAVLQAVSEARAIQAEFLADKGLTMDQARAMSKPDQAALQNEYSKWLQARQTAPGEALPAPATTIPAQPVAPQEATKAQPPAIRQQLFAEWGGQRHPVESLEDASRKWEAFRDKTGAGVSEVGNGVRVVDQAGKEVARVSYNGRVWPAGEWKKGDKPIYVPESETKTPPALLQKSGVIPDTAQKSGPDSSGATTTPREPWEMTRAEWGAFAWPKTEDTGATYTPSQIKLLLPKDYRRYQGKSFAGALPGSLLHRKAAVAEALKQGKPVPASVLADYPDLQQNLGTSQQVSATPETGPIAPKVGQAVTESAPTVSEQETTVAKNAPVERPAGKILGADVRDLSDANIAKFAKSKNKKVSDLAIREEARRKALVHSATALDTAPAKPEQSASQPSGAKATGITAAAAEGLANKSIPWKGQPGNARDSAKQKNGIVKGLVAAGIKEREATGIVEDALTRQVSGNRGGPMMFIQGQHLRAALGARKLLTEAELAAPREAPQAAVPESKVSAQTQSAPAEGVTPAFQAWQKTRMEIDALETKQRGVFISNRKDEKSKTAANVENGRLQKEIAALKVKAEEQRKAMLAELPAESPKPAAPVAPPRPTKPRMGETANELYAELKKAASGVVDGNYGVLYPVIRLPARGGTYRMERDGSYVSIGNRGMTATPATKVEISDIEDAIDTDTAEVNLMTRWGGSGRDNGSRFLRTLHSPSGNSWVQNKPAAKSEPAVAPAEPTPEQPVSAPAEKPLPAADIRAHIAWIVDRLSVLVTVYDDVAAANSDGATLPDDAQGFASKGRLGLVAENIKTLLDAETTLFHELFHVGIRAVARQAKDANAAFANYTAALNRVAMANPEVRRRAKAWRDKYGAEKAEQFRAAGIEDQLEARVRLTSFDEAIADMAGERLGKPIARLNELIAALQRLVRALGFDELANWMESKTDAEVLSLIRSAAQAVAAPSGQQRSTGVQFPSKMLSDGTNGIIADGELSYAQGNSVAGRQQLADRIDAVLRGASSRVLIYLGDTPKVLQRLGLDPLPMGMDEEVAGKSMFDHGVSSREMKALSDAIADPVAVVDSEARNAPDGSLVVITDLVKSDGRPIIVAVHPDAFLARVPSNGVASVYPKDNAKQSVARWLATKLRYVNNEKRPEWQRLSGVQFPGKMPAGGAGKIVLSEKEFVKGDFVAAWGDDPFTAPQAETPIQPGDVFQTKAGEALTVLRQLPGGRLEVRIQDKRRLRTGGYTNKQIKESGLEMIGRADLVDGAYVTPEALIRMAADEDPESFSRLDQGIMSELQTNEDNREITDRLQAALQAEGQSFTITPVSLPVAGDGTLSARGEREGRQDRLQLGEGASGVFGKQVAGADPDIMHARAGSEPFNAIQQSRGVANAVAGLFKSPSALGPVNFFNTPFHKAEMLERKGIPGYKRVFQRLQLYLNDISGFAVQAEQLMPSIMRELKGIMPKDFRAYFKGAASEADIAAIGPWLNHGTLYGGGSPMEGVVWTDDELRGNATLERPIPRGLKPLTAAQIPLYRQARAGIGQSLETSGKAVVHRHVTKFGITFDRDMSLADVAEIVRDQVIEKIETLQMRIDHAKDEAGTTFTDSRRLEAEIKNYQGAPAGLHDLRAAWEKAKAADDKASKYVEKLQAEQATLEALRGDTTEEADRKRLDREKANPGTIRGIAQHAKALIDHGYMPLKRFGNKTVTAYDEDGNTKFFGAYDGTPLTPGSANREMLRVAAEVKALHPEWRVVTGTRSEKAWKMYQGLSMDALENFLDFLDPETKAELERDKTIQEYLKNAVNDHSVLKQLIHRKGTPGFSTDVPRILASFVTSHARNASGLYHLSEAKRLVGEIPDQYGTVKDEAAELVDYVTKPGEEAAVLRSFLFFNFLGGSVAAAAINLTQTVMTTAPYLSQYTGVGKLTAAIGRAGKLAVGDPAVMTGELGKDLQRAELEGITAPQQIYHLAAMASNNPFSSDRRFRTAMAVWNGMFGAAEVFNRRIAFIAAHDIATERGMNVINEQLRKFAESRGEAAKRFDNAYDFAADAVDQTQFVYNKANRMNAARGPIGATVMTFKTFSVSWLELLRRLPPKQQLVMLGVLVLLAGAEGLPFEEDLADAVDTLGQWLGFTTNTGKWTGKAIRETLGSEFERPILKGLGGMLPIDLHSRLGLPNLIPGTAFAKPSEIDKTRDVAEAFGPVGGIMRNLMDGLQLMARGKWDRAALQAAPKAARDFYNGAYMMATGESQDTKGRLAMTDMTAAEGLGKLIGLNPQRAAREGEARREEMLDKNLRTVRMDEIASDWADGVIRKDQDKQKAARERMREWNRDNPELRIDGQQILRSVRERVKSARMTSQQRFLKSLPKTMRPEAREAFR